MRFVDMLLASSVLLVLAFPLTCSATDWKTFDDPKSLLQIGAFAKSINELPAPEKAAAIKRLQESLKSKEVEVRRRAALTLDSLGDKSGVPTMIEDLSKATGHDRDNVLVALRILKDERAIPTLREALKDKSPYVRGIAAAALGEMKSVKAYDDLVKLTKDKEGLDGGKKADGTLNCIRDCPAFTACYALGALGDERAAPVLIELLADADCQGPARQALEVLTKQKLGNDPERWKMWWKDKMVCAEDANSVVRDLGTIPQAGSDERLAQSLSALLRANPDDRVVAVEARLTLTEGKSLAYARFLYDRKNRLLLVLMRTALAEGGNFYHLQSYKDTDPGSFQRRLPVRGEKGYPKVSQSSKKAEVVIPVKYAAFPKLSEWP